MGIQTRRWARPRRRARYGPGVTLIAVVTCLFFAVALLRLLMIDFDWVGVGLLAVVCALLAWVLTPTWR